MSTFISIPRAEAVRQTAKAVLFRVGEEEAWIPRSHIGSRITDWEGYDGEVQITVWIAEKKGWQALGDNVDVDRKNSPPVLMITSDDVPNATKLYRKLVRKYHPDTGGSEAVMRDINALWQELFNDLRGNTKKPR